MGSVDGAAAGQAGRVGGARRLTSPLAVAEAPHSRALRPGEADWPHRLGDLADPPAMLALRGAIWPMHAPVVAIVGSRAATSYGRTFARRLAADVASVGWAVASGLARGIDAEAHEGALASDGVTLAVLPGGLSPVTPRAHAPLADRIAARGALLAERAEGVPFKGEFLRRNRLIAALADAVVVVEAATRSGALSTAAHARALGRPLLAVPGDVDRETSRGCHALLRDGARLCEGVKDVMDALGGRVHASTGMPRDAAEAGGARARLLAALGPAPQTVDALAERAALPVHIVVAELLALDWAGVAARAPGGRWRSARA